MQDVTFDDDGPASWSSTFVAFPVAFNAYVAFNLAELADVLDDGELDSRARLLGEAMDIYLWDSSEGLWSDLAVVGGGAHFFWIERQGAM